MKAAQEKATAMAGAISQTIGKAVALTEGNTIDRSYSTRIDSNITTELIDALPSGTSFAELLTTEAFSPGAIEVKATVTVSFILKREKYWELTIMIQMTNEIGGFYEN